VTDTECIELKNEVRLDTSKGPLAGVRVVDFGQVILAPFATRWLAWLGAEVILIESKKRAFQRVTPPFAYGRAGVNTGARFNTMNNNKISCTLNLKSPEAIALAKRLVEKADIVVENFSTGTMEKLGLGYASLREVNPGVVYLSGSAFGRTGAWRDYIGYHSSVNAFCGLAQVTGYAGGPPRLMGAVLPDTIGGMYITYAIMLALFHRRRTGEGSYIDFSMLEGMLSLMPQPVIDYTLNGHEWGRSGNRDAISTPHGIYRCQGDDRWISISVSSQAEWNRFCSFVGCPEWTNDPRFADELSRHRHADELDRLIEAWSITQDAGEASRQLQAAGIKAGEALSVQQLLEDEHLVARGFVVDIDHPESGRRKTVGLPWRIGGLSEPAYGPAPCLGQGNNYVFREVLGLSDQAIQELVKKDVIEG
jgi:crotonobetainyl-CoA:carnitine CoA-transferase CaiB-like acyl-CoA transferase